MGSPWLALDTEFMRERTYYPKLCLLQIATGDLTVCIDPLAVNTLDPVLDLLFHQATVKVLHAARQDLEIFYHLTGRVPAPIFDTQVAASFIGLGAQSGYAAVVEAILGVKLDKSQTRTDWQQRPLPPAALQYAANDVRYLARVYQRIEARLSEIDRREWAQAEMTSLTDSATYAPNPNSAWQRVRGIKRLKNKPAALSRVQALAAWREKTAMAANRPRQWILRDDALLGVARQAPVTPEELAAVRGVTPGLVKRRGQSILQVITAAAGSADAALSSAPSGPAQDAALDLLMALVRLKSAEQGISPAQLATRDELKQLLRGERDLDVLRDWRKQTVGQDLLALLAGKISLRVVGGRAVLERSAE
jgi:ribonuclease D